MSAKDIIALVTGASRGVGRGIAVALGSLGATVYVVGRTERPDVPPGVDETPLPGTIHEAAAAVDAAGGRGIAVSCDLGQDDQIFALFDRVGREQGRLDILVNNAAFLHRDLIGDKPFWEKSPAVGNILGVGLRSHYVASHQAAAMMAAAGSGLIVNISFFGAVCHFHGPAYGASKAGLDKMAFDMAADLRPFGVAAVSLWPGFVATERVKLMADHVPGLAEQIRDFETPEFTGHVIAALFRDPDLMTLSGKTLVVAELAAGYGIQDHGGRQPVSLRGLLGQPHAAFS